MRKDKRLLRDLELEVMNEIWRLKKPPLKGIHMGVLRHRKVAYTTIATVVDRLLKKGLITRHDDQPLYHYSATISIKDVVHAFVGHIKNNIYEGRKYL